MLPPNLLFTWSDPVVEALALARPDLSHLVSSTGKLVLRALPARDVEARAAFLVRANDFAAPAEVRRLIFKHRVGPFAWFVISLAWPSDPRILQASEPSPTAVYGYCGCATDRLGWVVSFTAFTKNQGPNCLWAGLRGQGVVRPQLNATEKPRAINIQLS